MAQKVVREKTKIPSIYFNRTTGKYDVKYNYKEYDPIQGKNVYKAKWKYNLRTMVEAKEVLAKLQTGAEKTADKDITLEGIYQVWLKEAEANGYSVVSIRNTEQQVRMIYQFLPPETKLKNEQQLSDEEILRELKDFGKTKEEIEAERLAEEMGLFGMCG